MDSRSGDQPGGSTRLGSKLTLLVAACSTSGSFEEG